METLIGFCKLCGRDLAIKDYTIIREDKDHACVIAEGRVHEMLFGKRADTARKVEAIINQGFSENRAYRNPAEESDDTSEGSAGATDPETVSYDELPDREAPEKIR